MNFKTVAKIICFIQPTLRCIGGLRKKAMFTPKTDLQKMLGRIAICCDAAHAFGASRKEKMVGAIADFSSFSFHAVKN